MDFDLPADDDPRRLKVRQWLADNPSPDGKTLAAAGYVVPHWPEPWGLNADPIEQIIIDDEKFGWLRSSASNICEMNSSLRAMKCVSRTSLSSAISLSAVHVRPKSGEDAKNKCVRRDAK